jgi:hypothetical protein
LRKVPASQTTANVKIIMMMENKTTILIAYIDFGQLHWD